VRVPTSRRFDSAYGRERITLFVPSSAASNLAVASSRACGSTREQTSKVNVGGMSRLFRHDFRRSADRRSQRASRWSWSAAPFRVAAPSKSCALPGWAWFTRRKTRLHRGHSQDRLAPFVFRCAGSGCIGEIFWGYIGHAGFAKPSVGRFYLAEVLADVAGRTKRSIIPSVLGAVTSTAG